MSSAAMAESTHELLVKGRKIILKPCPEECITDVANLLLDAGAKGNGVGMDDFPTQDHLYQHLRDNVTLVGQTEAGHLVVAFCFYPSPMCRSTHALYSAGYMVIHKDFRNQGYATELMKGLGGTSDKAFLRRKNGKDFHGSLARAAIVARSLVPARQSGYNHFLGIIPNSMLTPKFGLVDDIISFRSLGDPSEFKVSEELPPLMKEVQPNNWLHSTINFTPRKLTSKTFTRANIILTQPDGDDIWLLEEMIRAAAKRGDFFGIDEFTDKGHYNRKFFKKTHVLLAKADGDVAGAVIVGPAAICRTQAPTSAHLHVIIDPMYRGRGLGTELLRVGCDVAKTLGYEGVMTDLLMTDQPWVPRMVKKRGFMITGSLPNCAYVIGQGWADSLLMFRDLREHGPVQSKL